MTRSDVRRRGRAVPLAAAIASLALHGLAIASVVGWPDGRAPDVQPRIIAVGMVFAEREAGDPSEVAVTREANLSTPSDQHLAETVEAAVAVEQPPRVSQPDPPPQAPVAESAIDEQPAPAPEAVPPSVVETQRALSDPSPEEAESEPSEPFAFFDEGTVLIDRSPDNAPGLPARRPVTPVAFQPGEPSVVEPPTAQPSAPDPAAAAPAPPADQAGDRQPVTPSVMAMQPARYTGPGLANPGPEYPRSARRRGDEGTVVLRVMVSAAGLPQYVQIRSSSGFETLDQAAVAAVEGWRFIAARRGDIAVPATIDVPIAFRLTDD